MISTCLPLYRPNNDLHFSFQTRFGETWGAALASYTDRTETTILLAEDEYIICVKVYAGYNYEYFVLTGMIFITNKGEHIVGDLDGSILGVSSTLVAHECGTTLRYLGGQLGSGIDSVSLYFSLC